MQLFTTRLLIMVVALGCTGDPRHPHPHHPHPCSSLIFILTLPQDNAKLLGDHTVAYLNVDSGVSGKQCTGATSYSNESNIGSPISSRSSHLFVFVYMHVWLYVCSTSRFPVFHCCCQPSAVRDSLSGCSNGTCGYLLHALSSTHLRNWFTSSFPPSPLPSLPPSLPLPLPPHHSQVKCPNPGFNTVYDEWLHFTP